MGITESKCVNLESEEGYQLEEFSVRRTSGVIEDGHKITWKAHSCLNVDPRSWKPRAHAVLQEDGWRVHIHNGDQTSEVSGKYLYGSPGDGHVCGWRRLGTFWPTRLTGDEAAIEIWTAEFKARLEALADEQGLPQEYRPHTCSLNSSECSACFWEKRAKDKKEKRDLLAVLKSQLTEVEIEQDDDSLDHGMMAALDARWNELDHQIHQLENELEAL